MKTWYFTSESVTEGHPDKVCDAVSDAVLDAILSQDKNARVACECAATTGVIMVMGEITSTAQVDFQSVVRDRIRQIGYTDSEYGFDADSCAVLVTLDKQSPDIAMGVDSAYDNEKETGAGDQGMMFGFACDETEEYMPMAISLAHKLTKRLADVRKSGELSYLRPDGKAQVTVKYHDDTPVSVDTVVVSTQHSADIDMEQLRSDILEHVIKAVIPSELMDGDTKYFINPTGRFVVGGPHGDSGLTGRKIIVDTYGGYARHGGGAFSGKDPTKVDRSAAYMARYVAKNIVAAGLAKKCELQIAYAIGVAQPVAININVNTYGTASNHSDEQLEEIVKKAFDLRPGAIIEKLGLRAPVYSPTSAYGHFGRNEFSWEKLDSVELLKSFVK
ncbi:MAG: methionine adenosyltransferase [Clostridia bacterium]|nr:methionine adenosyltransferase [Clostridia bacterium]